MMSSTRPPTAAGAAGPGPCDDALVPSAVARGDGGDANDSRRSRGAASPTSSPGRAASAPRCSGPTTSRRSTCRDRSISMSAGSRSRRTWARCWTCRWPPGPSWWWVTDRPAIDSGPGIPGCVSSVRNEAWSLPGTMPVAMYSCSRAGPRPSAWCCSRRWPPVCR